MVFPLFQFVPIASYTASQYSEKSVTEGWLLICKLQNTVLFTKREEQLRNNNSIFVVTVFFKYRSIFLKNPRQTGISRNWVGRKV